MACGSRRDYEEQLEEDYISYVAGNFRTIRFGVAEPHGRGEMMEFNYMIERGAVTRDAASGRYAVVLGKMPDVLGALAKELLEQEATGDRGRTARGLQSMRFRRTI